MRRAQPRRKSKRTRPDPTVGCDESCGVLHQFVLVRYLSCQNYSKYEQILIVGSRKVISNGADLNRKGKKRRDSKETFGYRVSRIRLCLTRLAYQVPWAGDSRIGVCWLIYALEVIGENDHLSGK